MPVHSFLCMHDVIPASSVFPCVGNICFSTSSHTTDTVLLHAGQFLPLPCTWYSAWLWHNVCPPLRASTLSVCIHNVLSVVIDGDNSCTIDRSCCFLLLPHWCQRWHFIRTRVAAATVIMFLKSFCHNSEIGMSDDYTKHSSGMAALSTIPFNCSSQFKWLQRRQ